MDASELLDARVLLVTGKGGVGKSTLAAALAVAATRTGRRTSLVEVEGRQTMARLLATEPWGFGEREIRPGLFGISIDPEASLVEYLDMFYGARRLSRLVASSTAVEFATAAAPGIKDVLSIGKVKEMERRRDADGRFHYDLIVVDAPPTGRIVNFLRAPQATTQLVHVGPIRDQAQSLVDLLLDGTRTRLQLVTLLEEMPVAETVDSVAALRDLGVALNPILINRVLPARLDDAARKVVSDGLEPAEVAETVKAAGIDADVALGAELLSRGRRHIQRHELQSQMRRWLDGKVGAQTLELPLIASVAFGEAEINRLADIIEDLVAS